MHVGAKTIAGSLTGGTQRIKEMLDFCSAKKVYPEIELIKMEQVNEAHDRLVKSDIKFRFVIDIANSLE